MRKLTTVVTMAALGLGLGFASSARAANALTSEELVTFCQGKDATFVTCEIYGQAVYDTYLVTRHPETAKEYICVKQPAPPRKQIIGEYVAWAIANPTYAQQPAADTILRFLAERFPCGK